MRSSSGVVSLSLVLSFSRPTREKSYFCGLKNMFFNPQKYDFSRVGRLKLNTKLKLTTPLDERILHPQDFYEVISYLLKLRKNTANVDDIDHLGNRREIGRASCR